MAHLLALRTLEYPVNFLKKRGRMEALGIRFIPAAQVETLLPLYLHPPPFRGFHSKRRLSRHLVLEIHPLFIPSQQLLAFAAHLTLTLQ